MRKNITAWFNAYLHLHQSGIWVTLILTRKQASMYVYEGGGIKVVLISVRSSPKRQSIKRHDPQPFTCTPSILHQSIPHDHQHLPILTSEPSSLITEIFIIISLLLLLIKLQIEFSPPFLTRHCFLSIISI